MTYSIIARDRDSQTIGVATATGSLAVGGFVPHVQFDLGAVATQGAFTNWLYADRAMNALREGKSADQALSDAIRHDQGSAYRQLIVMDRWGNTAGYTGEQNLASKLHHLEKDFAVAGNMLSSDDVVSAMRSAFHLNHEQPMHERLIRALEAAESQGGDFRGVHSCAIKVQYFNQPPLDLRVDWSDATCIQDLRDLYQKSLSHGYQGFIQGVPTLADPSKYGQISSEEV